MQPSVLEGMMYPWNGPPTPGPYSTRNLGDKSSMSVHLEVVWVFVPGVPVSRTSGPFIEIAIFPTYDFKKDQQQNIFF